jgi:hypothetical protein
LKTYRIDGKDVIGLAYAVLSEFWNQGYATEMAQAGVQVGFEQLGFTEICSWTLPVNLASQRVMEKLGFRYEREFEFAGLKHRFFRLLAGDWEGQRSDQDWNFDRSTAYRQAVEEVRCLGCIGLPYGQRCLTKRGNVAYYRVRTSGTAYGQATLHE